MLLAGIAISDAYPCTLIGLIQRVRREPATLRR